MCTFIAVIFLHEILLITRDYFRNTLSAQVANKQTNKPTKELNIYMDHSLSWEADSSSVSQEIGCILCKSKGNYCCYNIPSFLFVVSQTHRIQSCYCNMRFNIILA
jgi:hypothetical protein